MSHTIGRSPRSVFLVRSSPRVPVRFVFTFIQRLVVPPTLPRGHPIASADPSASLRYPEPPRFHGRPRNGVSNHTRESLTHHWHTRQNTVQWAMDQPPLGDEDPIEQSAVTDSSNRPPPSGRTHTIHSLSLSLSLSLLAVVARANNHHEPKGGCFPSDINSQTDWPAATIATAANTARTCWCDLALAIESVSEARVQGRRTINRGVETSHRDDTLWHPPKGAPREPSTSCCQSCRAAAMARASRLQRLRRRHPSHAGGVVAATPGPYLPRTLSFKSRYVVVLSPVNSSTAKIPANFSQSDRFLLFRFNLYRDSRFGQWWDLKDWMLYFTTVTVQFKRFIRTRNFWWENRRLNEIWVGRRLD